MLQRRNYSVSIADDTDWTMGAHSENVRLNAWTMYTRFPYDVRRDGGWHDETPSCASNGTVLPGENRSHVVQNDWDELARTTAWVRARAAEQEAARERGEAIKPFFAYQGMNIVHPPYITNERWLAEVDESSVDVPEWRALDDPELHPCDLQSTMLKWCAPSDAQSAAFHDRERRRRLRRIYYASIAEFDAMVGEYVDAAPAGTVFVITSDHGDMAMEHQQHYKMVPYEASARVPLLIAAPGLAPDAWEDAPVSLVDLFPTFMDIAGVPQANRPAGLDGHSLAPLLLAAQRRGGEGGGGEGGGAASEQ